MPATQLPKNMVPHKPPNQPDIHIIKIASDSVKNLAFVSNWGSVFCYCTDSLESRKNVPWRVWTPKIADHNAIDAAVGISGSVIICTQSGHVWTSTPKGKSMKFEKMCAVQRVISVHAGISGSFAAIRQEPFLSCTSIQKITPIKRIESLFTKNLEENDPQNIEDFCFIMDDGRVWAHKAILVAQIPRFSSLKSSKSADGIYFKVSADGNSIRMHNCCKLAMKIVLSFLYTGEFMEREILSNMVCRILDYFNKGSLKPFYLNRYKAIDTADQDYGILWKTGKESDVLVHLSDKVLKLHRIFLNLRFVVVTKSQFSFLSCKTATQFPMG